VDEPGIRPGAVVRSIAGRDIGSCYLVLRLLDERRVTVSDGRRRSVDRPKAKNRRHLEVLGWCEPALALKLDRAIKVTDLDIEKALAVLPARVLEEV
jgi:large subunit ribosomal protein L14e